MGSNNTGGSSGNYRNPCLTMHQPWASLLVHGIKRIEGRSWPSPIKGRLWIHAAGKVPEHATIKAMEDFYREIYAVNGITDIKFPDSYPTSSLLGCVEVVGCVTLEELRCWEDIPEGVRLEGQTNFCWLCEQPQKLIIPFEMRGYQGVYNLERKIFDSAIRGLAPIGTPLEFKFPVRNPQDRFSLKPRSLVADSSGPSEIEKKSPTLAAAISGARLAANQFSKNQSQTHDDVPISTRTRNRGGKQGSTYRKKEVETLPTESHVSLPGNSDSNGINKG